MFRGLVLSFLVALTLATSVSASAFAADPTAAASPAPSPGASPVLIDPLDPRAGEGASRVGAPLLAVVLVVGIGTLTVLATLAYVRVSRRT